MKAADKYCGADNLINAIAYDITEGGDLVLGKPHTHEALKSHVYHLTQTYEDTRHITREDVNKRVALWLSVLNGATNIVPRSLP